MLAVNTSPVWWQRWELHPHQPGYEPGALLLSYAAVVESEVGIKPTMIAFAVRRLITWLLGLEGLN
jgi:hypothetical protein